MKLPVGVGLRRLGVALFALASVYAEGCAPSRTARIRYMHPSPLSRWGRRVRIEPFDNEGDTRFSAQVEEAVRRSGVFELLADRAQMAITGEVLENATDPEQNTSRPHTCARTVPEQRTRTVPVMLSVNPPRVEMRAETYTEMVQQQYACTELVRAVDGRFRVHVRINARTRPIQVVFDQRYELSDRRETTGLSGSDREDRVPPPIDHEALLRELRRQAVERFTRAALPALDTVEVEFGDCRDQRCEQAIQLVRGGGLEQAETLFTLAIEQYQRMTDVDSRRRLAAALYNRGLVRGYGEKLAEGIDDIRLAIATDGRDPSWSRQLATLQELQSEIEASTFRGETPGAGATPTPTGRPAGRHR